jgi:hypothetical protein
MENKSYTKVMLLFFRKNYKFQTGVIRSKSELFPGLLQEAKFYYVGKILVLFEETEKCYLEMCLKSLKLLLLFNSG